MRVIYVLALTAMVSYTVMVEENDILMTKLSLRCMLFIFSFMSFDLWLRGIGYKGTMAHLAAILLILCTDDTKPCNAAPLLLFYEIIAIIAFLAYYNLTNMSDNLPHPFIL